MLVVERGASEYTHLRGLLCRTETSTFLTSFKQDEESTILSIVWLQR